MHCSFFLFVATIAMDQKCANGKKQPLRAHWPMGSEQSEIIFYIYETMGHAYEFIEPNSVGH